MKKQDNKKSTKSKKSVKQLEPPVKKLESRPTLVVLSPETTPFMESHFEAPCSDEFSFETIQFIRLTPNEKKKREDRIFNRSNSNSKNKN